MNEDTRRHPRELLSPYLDDELGADETGAETSTGSSRSTASSRPSSTARTPSSSQSVSPRAPEICTLAMHQPTFKEFMKATEGGTKLTGALQERDKKFGDYRTTDDS